MRLESFHVSRAGSGEEALNRLAQGETFDLVILDLRLPGLNGLRAKKGLAPFESPFEMFKNPERVIITSGDPLEYPRTDLPEKIKLVGPQLWDPPAETPAWLYFLCEARQRENGERVGATASHIIADTIVGLMRLNPASLLNHPGVAWHPRQSVLTTPGAEGLTTIRKLLRFAVKDTALAEGG